MMKPIIFVAFLSSVALAREDGLFRGSSVSEVQSLYGNSCPARQEQCQAALALASHNSIQDNKMLTETPSFDFLQTIAQDPAVWSKIRKLRHIAANLDHWTPDRLNLSIRKLLRLAHSLSQFLSDTWNVSLSAPIAILEALATKQSPNAFFVVNNIRTLLQDTTKTILTMALVPDADADCEILAWTCQYQRMLHTILPLLEEDTKDALRSSVYL